MILNLLYLGMRERQYPPFNSFGPSGVFFGFFWERLLGTGQGGDGGTGLSKE